MSEINSMNYANEYNSEVKTHTYLIDLKELTKEAEDALYLFALKNPEDYYVFYNGHHHPVMVKILDANIDVGALSDPMNETVNPFYYSSVEEELPEGIKLSYYSG